MFFEIKTTIFIGEFFTREPRRRPTRARGLEPGEAAGEAVQVHAAGMVRVEEARRTRGGFGRELPYTKDSLHLLQLRVSVEQRQKL